MELWEWDSFSVLQCWPRSDRGRAVGGGGGRKEILTSWECQAHLPPGAMPTLLTLNIYNKISQISHSNYYYLSGLGRSWRSFLGFVCRTFLKLPGDLSRIFRSDVDLFVVIILQHLNIIIFIHHTIRVLTNLHSRLLFMLFMFLFLPILVSVGLGLKRKICQVILIIQCFVQTQSWSFYCPCVEIV